MKNIITVLLLATCAMSASAVQKGDSADPVFAVGTLPQSNRSTAAITNDTVASTASVSSVAISSSVITRIDTVFNAAALSALGITYKRAEITVQNNGTTNKFCGYSYCDLTVLNGYKLTPGAVWVFQVGKNMPVYCLVEAGSMITTPAETLIVGGVAWK
jgi:hypothetical protein